MLDFPVAEQNVNFLITAVDQATRVLQGVGTSLDGVMKSYRSLQGVFAGAGVGLAMQKIVSATIDAERASARLDSALRATAYSAGITRAELDQMAETLKRDSPFDDDEIRKGISALLRFRDVQGDIFRDAAKLAPDLAVALDTDVVGAYTRIGRALEDPEKGLRALREAGLNVSGTQERVNKVMKETGDIAAAQRIILDDLTKSIGGAAAGENNGLYGSVKAVDKAWDDVLKGLGRNEVAMNRMVRTAKMTEAALRAVGAIPENSPTREPTSGERADAMRGQRERDVEREIERLNKIVGDAEEKQRKEDAEREKRLRDDDLKGWVAHAEARIQANLEEAQANAKFHIDENKRLEENREAVIALIDPIEKYRIELVKIRELAGRGMITSDQWAAAEFEINNQIEKVQGLNREVAKINPIAEDLGMTFASAFEGAIVQGQKLHVILEGLARDVLRIFVRRTVTEPMAGYLTTAFSGAFGGGGGGEIGHAGGIVGHLPRYHSGGIAGDEVPAILRRGEGVFTEEQMRALGGVSIVQNIHVDSRSDIASIRQAMNVAKREAVLEVEERVSRGGGYSSTFRR